jgi:hypothetical protein
MVFEKYPWVEDLALERPDCDVSAKIGAEPLGKRLRICDANDLAFSSAGLPVRELKIPDAIGIMISYNLK